MSLTNPTNLTSVVQVRGLCKSYESRMVVDHLDLDVPAGQIVGLIGSNGAGKTTTVECLQGLRTPDAGTIRVLGLDPTADADRLRGLIGSQLQESGLPDRMRVSEAVDLFDNTRAGLGPGLLERFGLAARRRTAFSSLSGGEQQRLFLVLALLNRPRLVILDELTQGLDPAARRTVWQSVSDLRAEGTTVLLVTHELEEASALCDQVVAMRAGRVLAKGSPDELIDRYARWASVGFSLPDSQQSAMLHRLDALPGVRHVTRSPGRISVTGERRMVAHVGAALVDAGDVPGDLRVAMPSLEDALLELLEGEGSRPAAEAPPATAPVVTGALR